MPSRSGAAGESPSTAICSKRPVSCPCSRLRRQNVPRRFVASGEAYSANPVLPEAKRTFRSLFGLCLPSLAPRPHDVCNLRPAFVPPYFFSQNARCDGWFLWCLTRVRAAPGGEIGGAGPGVRFFLRPTAQPRVRTTILGTLRQRRLRKCPTNT
jgi:hypothetical protein